MLYYPTLRHNNTIGIKILFFESWSSVFAGMMAANLVAEQLYIGD